MSDNLHFNAEQSVVAAVQFEQLLRELVSMSMGEGLSVTNAIGTLELIKTEAQMSFFVNSGHMNELMRGAFFSGGKVADKKKGFNGPLWYDSEMGIIFEPNPRRPGVDRVVVSDPQMRLDVATRMVACVNAYHGVDNPKDGIAVLQATELELVSTDDLLQELYNRFNAVFVLCHAPLDNELVTMGTPEYIRCTQSYWSASVGREDVGVFISSMQYTLDTDFGEGQPEDND